jgi:hypothetical protein
MKMSVAVISNSDAAVEASRAVLSGDDGLEMLDEHQDFFRGLTKAFNGYPDNVRPSSLLRAALDKDAVSSKRGGSQATVVQLLQDTLTSICGKRSYNGGTHLCIVWADRCCLPTTESEWCKLEVLQGHAVLWIDTAPHRRDENYDVGSEDADSFQEAMMAKVKRVKVMTPEQLMLLSREGLHKVSILPVPTTRCTTQLEALFLSTQSPKHMPHSPNQPYVARQTRTCLS